MDLRECDVDSRQQQLWHNRTIGVHASSRVLVIGEGVASSKTVKCSDVVVLITPGPGVPGPPAAATGSPELGQARGGYPGGYPNWNSKNPILSPRYGGGYGGNAYGMGGSPFSNSVQRMGYSPSLKSKGFGKKAALAAGAGAVAGLALGYGLSRIPRPHFHFRSPEEEYYYNHYMYRRYGSQSTDNYYGGRDGGLGGGGLDGGRGSGGRDGGGQGGRDGGGVGGHEGGQNYDDYQFKPPPQAYDFYMENCMKRTDLLGSQSVPASSNMQGDEGYVPGKNGAQSDDPNASDGAGILSSPEPAMADQNMANDTVNGTVKDGFIERSQPNPTAMTLMLTAGGENKDIPGDDDEVVSIVEIGYPELIEQLKARRCVELYMVYAEHHAQEQKQKEKEGKQAQTNTRSNPHFPTGSGEVQRPLCQELVLLLTSSFMVLSSMLLLQ
ncbi:hypothetical protein GJAV_G00032860 [Gymnothorax javanicus]|nr:hypothetical protein GJAV_G00032860 [Gymnothorax javanicus]